MSKRAFLQLIGFFAILCGLASVVAAGAQAPPGEIRGTVSDPTGALIPSAQVQLNGANGTSRSVTGGHDGSFQIGSVAPGKYRSQ